MKTSRTILAIMLTTCAFNLDASYIAHNPECSLMKTSFERLSDTGIANMEKGWNKITHPGKKNVSDFLSSRPYEIGTQKIVCGTAQIVYGTSQVVIGDTIEAAIKHPDKAIITAMTLGYFMYIATL